MIATVMGFQFRFEVSPLDPIAFLIHSAHRIAGTMMHYMNGYYFYIVTAEVLKHPLQLVILIFMAAVPAFLFLLGIIQMLKERKPINLYLFLLFFAPFALIWMEGTSGKYYVMGAAPFLIISALGLHSFSKRYRTALLALVVLVAALALGNAYTSLTSTYSPENPRDLSKYVAENRLPGDTVLFVGGMNGSHTWRYYNSEGTIYGNPNWSEHNYRLLRGQQPESYLRPWPFIK